MAASLLLLIFALALIWYRRDCRRELLVSGLLGTPFGLFSFEFIGRYWKPNVVAFYIASPEDLIFSFSVAVIVWALATWFLRAKLKTAYTWRTACVRYLLLSLLGIGVAYAIKWTHPIGVMNAALVSVTAVGLVIISLRRDLWPLAMHGAAWFLSFYTAWMVLNTVLWPHFLIAWQCEELLAVDFFGMPVYEFLWALADGLVWPLFVGYILGVSLCLSRDENLALERI